MLRTITISIVSKDTGHGAFARCLVYNNNIITATAYHNGCGFTF